MELYSTHHNFMGALFSQYGAAAGNSAVVHWMSSVMLDVVLMPAVAILLLYNVFDSRKSDSNVFVTCLWMVGVLCLVWVMSWGLGQFRLVLVKPDALTNLSKEFITQANIIATLRNKLGGRFVADNQASDNLSESKEMAGKSSRDS
jgi:hypothetical protein